MNDVSRVLETVHFESQRPKWADDDNNDEAISYLIVLRTYGGVR